MASVVDICNLALSGIGADPISSITEQTEQAKQCNIHYARVRDSLLAEHDWGFARKETSLALLSGTAPDNWTYQYLEPSDCISPRKIVNSISRKKALPFERFHVDNHHCIATDQEDAFLIYTMRMEVTGLFPPLFVDAVATRLAWRIAFPLTKSKDIKDEAGDEAIKALSSALRDDQNSRVRDQSVEASWVEARD